MRRKIVIAVIAALLTLTFGAPELEAVGLVVFANP